MMTTRAQLCPFSTKRARIASASRNRPTTLITTSSVATASCGVYAMSSKDTSMSRTKFDQPAATETIHRMPARTRRNTSTAPATVEGGRFMSGSTRTGLSSSEAGSNAGRLFGRAHEAASTATGRTSTIGRSPSVRMLSPPPLRA